MHPAFIFDYPSKNCETEYGYTIFTLPLKVISIKNSDLCLFYRVLKKLKKISPDSPCILVYTLLLMAWCQLQSLDDNETKVVSDAVQLLCGCTPGPTKNEM